jgi:YfiH family protein
MKNLQLFSNLAYAASVKADGNMDFRWGKAAEVLKNRTAFLEKFRLAPENSIVMEVEHKEKILVVGHDDTTGIKTQKNITYAEAFITKEKNLALLLMTADCLPVAFYDPIQEVIALAHLGWKPTNRNLISKVIAKMTLGFHSHPKDIHVSIGPAIHKDSYIFEEAVQKKMPEWAPFLEEIPDGKIKIDLIGFNKEALLNSGIVKEHIFVDPNDTFVSNGYFSHYRSVRTGEPEGRFLTALALP